MEVRKFFGVLWYHGLLISGLWVAHKSFTEYASGGTGRTTSKELITENDLPTLFSGYSSALNVIDSLAKNFWRQIIGLCSVFIAN